eukprot:gene3345-5892_t
MTELSIVPFAFGIFSEMILGLIGLYLGGFWTSLSFFYTFCGLPITDYLFGNNKWNPSEKDSKELRKNPNSRTF